jgi:hypothetical protein
MGATQIVNSVRERLDMDPDKNVNLPLTTHQGLVVDPCSALAVRDTPRYLRGVGLGEDSGMHQDSAIRLVRSLLSLDSIPHHVWSIFKSFRVAMGKPATRAYFSQNRSLELRVMREHFVLLSTTARKIGHIHLFLRARDSEVCG